MEYENPTYHPSEEQKKGRNVVNKEDFIIKPINLYTQFFNLEQSAIMIKMISNAIEYTDIAFNNGMENANLFLDTKYVFINDPR